MSMYEAYVKHHWRVKSSRDAVWQERHRTKWRGFVQETLDICFVENRIQSNTEAVSYTHLHHKILKSNKRHVQLNDCQTTDEKENINYLLYLFVFNDCFM